MFPNYSESVRYLRLAQGQRLNVTFKLSFMDITRSLLNFEKDRLRRLKS